MLLSFVGCRPAALVKSRTPSVRARPWAPAGFLLPAQNLEQSRGSGLYHAADTLPSACTLARVAALCRRPIARSQRLEPRLWLLVKEMSAGRMKRTSRTAREAGRGARR